MHIGEHGILRDACRQSETNRLLAADVVQEAARYGSEAALFSGTHAGLIGGHRISDDVDLWVPDHAMEQVCQAFPERVFRGDDRTIVSVERHGGKLELMAHMVIHISEANHHAVYPFPMTPEAQSRVRHGTIDGWEIPYADPVDTILLKAILQRGGSQGKHDLEDIAAIGQNVSIDQGYLRRRIIETGSRRRVGPLLRQMGILRPRRTLSRLWHISRPAVQTAGMFTDDLGVVLRAAS